MIDTEEADEARRRNLRHDGRTKETDLDPRLELAAAAGRFAIGNELRDPEKVLTLAETALGVGVTLEQAISIAHWYNVLVCVWTFEDHEADEVQLQASPDWQMLARRIGSEITPAQVKSWIRKGISAVAKWDRQHPRPKAAKQ